MHDTHDRRGGLQGGRGAIISGTSFVAMTVSSLRPRRTPRQRSPRGAPGQSARRLPAHARHRDALALSRTRGRQARARSQRTPLPPRSRSHARRHGAGFIEHRQHRPRGVLALVATHVDDLLWALRRLKFSRSAARRSMRASRSSISSGGDFQGDLRLAQTGAARPGRVLPVLRHALHYAPRSAQKHARRLRP